MIVVDSSAVCAILFGEPEKPDFEVAIAAGRPLLPASCLVEAGIAWRRHGGLARTFDALVAALDLEVVPLNAEQARLAVEADRRYGRGSGHPARLNFGDCLAYAAAKARGVALLYKGDDFVHTDVERAA